MQDEAIMDFLKYSYESRFKNKKLKKDLKEYEDLVSWYFNDKDEKRDIIVCAHKAYDDIKRNLKGIGAVDSEKKKVYRGKVENYIKESIEKLVSEKPDFDEWHDGVCNGIISLTDEQGINEHLNKKGIEFTYGLAQKWLNMTLKYALIMKLDIKLPVKDLHVPVDRYILRAASEEKTTEYGLGILLPYKHISSESPVYGKYSDEKTKPWSKWGDEDEDKVYKKFQEDIKKAIGETKFSSPIEWEGPAWLYIAKKKKKNK